MHYDIEIRTVQQGTSTTDHYHVGTARVRRSFSGSWFIDGQAGAERRAYVAERLQDALNLARTVDHFNRTGEAVAFSVDDQLAAWLG